jgi:uncharacterized membrane protein YdfJ with MMPL/SSD domain
VIVGLAARDEAPDRLIRRSAPSPILAAQLRSDYPELTLRWTGETALNVDLRRTSSVDVGAAERRALPLTALLLLVGFGAVAAAVLPVVAGALAIALALGAAALLAPARPLSILLQSVVTMLGLGLGIDYALLAVSRFREASMPVRAPRRPRRIPRGMRAALSCSRRRRSRSASSCCSPCGSTRSAPSRQAACWSW